MNYILAILGAGQVRAPLCILGEQMDPYPLGVVQKKEDDSGTEEQPALELSGPTFSRQVNTVHHFHGGSHCG